MKRVEFSSFVFLYYVLVFSVQSDAMVTMHIIFIEYS